MNEARQQLGRDTPATYRIRLKGKLEETWSDYLEGMAITSNQTGDEVPVTTLTGLLVDQAALSGVLDSLYNLGFPLLSVECLDCG